ncbi:MAG: hypothetical protein ACI9TH_003629 [Kiritimatiellia bacterium]|jgi:hypothetical protein
MSMTDELSQEKNRFVALVVMTLIVAVLIGLILIRPQVQRLTSLQHELEYIDEQASTHVPVHPEKQASLRSAHNTHRQLQHDIEWLSTRFNSFSQMPPFLPDIGEQAGGRIDFKVALLEARDHLQAKAGTGHTFPEQLGMPETIATDEKAESRLRQLAAIVKLVEQLQAIGVADIDRIQPLLPLTYPKGPGDEGIKREFPVQIRFECAYGELIQFLDSLLRPESFFTLRRLECEKLNSDASDQIRVTAVCGAGLVQDHLPEPLAQIDAAPPAANNDVQTVPAVAPEDRFPHSWEDGQR